MDTLDLILNGLRYAPLCLMGMGGMMLLWIQVKELFYLYCGWIVFYFRIHASSYPLPSTG